MQHPHKHFNFQRLLLSFFLFNHYFVKKENSQIKIPFPEMRDWLLAYCLRDMPFSQAMTELGSLLLYDRVRFELING